MNNRKPEIVLLACLLIAGPLPAAQRMGFERRVEVAPSPYSTEGAEFVIRDCVNGRVRIALDDDAGRLSTHLPARLHVVGELAVKRLAGDVPLFVLVSSPRSVTAQIRAPAGPASFAGSDNGLHPSLDEPIPRRLEGFSPPLDSDDDGVPDSQDDFPNDPAESTDTDGDGIGNNADPDDDNDGMADSYETANGLDSLTRDAAGDLDHDGQNNGDEYIAGTRADDPTSTFRALAPAADREAGKVTLRWTSRPGKRYSILFTESLGPPPHQVLAEGIPAADGAETQHKLNLPTSDTGFFIIRVHP